MRHHNATSPAQGVGFILEAQGFSSTNSLIAGLICMAIFTSSAALGNHLALPGAQDLHSSQDSDGQAFIHQLETINTYLPPNARLGHDAEVTAPVEQPTLPFPSRYSTQSNVYPSGTPPLQPSIIKKSYIAPSAIPAQRVASQDHIKIGWNLLLNGRPEAAMAAYRQALRQSPHSATAYIGVGIACKRLGNIEGAKQAIQQALELNPQLSSALVHWGYLYADGHFGHSDAETARRFFNQASHLGDPFARIALLDLQYREP